MRKLPEVVTEEELKKLVQETKKRHHKLAYKLGFYQGLRISEVRKLLPENVKRDQKLLLIKQAKGDKDRNIPIMPEVFRDLRGLPIGIGDRALQIAFKSHAKRILKKDLHFHILRHSCGTWLHNIKKWPIRDIQVFLGHARLDTTMIYTHVSARDLVNRVWGGE